MEASKGRARSIAWTVGAAPSPGDPEWRPAALQAVLESTAKAAWAWIRDVRLSRRAAGPGRARTSRSPSGWHGSSRSEPQPSARARSRPTQVRGAITMTMREVHVDLDYLVIRRWLEALSRGFVTSQRPQGQPHTVRLCYSLLRAALQSAVERDVLEKQTRC